ncbi:MAG: large conductance mechanosensitive channel protein MscL [Gaiellaceae bacterium]
MSPSTREVTMRLLGGFKEFVLRGNLLDLAIAFVLGLAFAALIQSFVDDIVMQIVAAIFGRPDFSGLAFDLGKSEIRYGAFLTALLVFLIIAAVLYLLYQASLRIYPRQTTTRDCPHCLSAIPIGAGTCGFCTKEVGAGAPV